MHFEIRVLNSSLRNMFNGVSYDVVIQLPTCDPPNYAFVVIRATSIGCGATRTVNNDFAKFSCTPLPAEARQALPASEQFLHRALLEMTFFGDELLQGFDEGISVTQGVGDDLLFGFLRRQDYQ